MSTGCDLPAQVKGLMPVEQARAFLLSQAVVVDGTEVLDLRQACGRVLAEPVISSVNVPPNSRPSARPVLTTDNPPDCNSKPLPRPCISRRKDVSS